MRSSVVQLIAMLMLSVPGTQGARLKRKKISARAGVKNNTLANTAEKKCFAPRTDQDPVGDNDPDFEGRSPEEFPTYIQGPWASEFLSRSKYGDEQTVNWLEVQNFVLDYTEINLVRDNQGKDCDILYKADVDIEEAEWAVGVFQYEPSLDSCGHNKAFFDLPRYASRGENKIWFVPRDGSVQQDCKHGLVQCTNPGCFYIHPKLDERDGSIKGIGIGFGYSGSSSSSSRSGKPVIEASIGAITLSGFTDEGFVTIECSTSQCDTKMKKGLKYPVLAIFPKKCTETDPSTWQGKDDCSW